MNAPSTASPASQRRRAILSGDLLDKSYRSASPLRTLVNLLDIRWYGWFGYLILFLSKNAPFWGTAGALYGAVHILENSDRYPLWFLFIPIGAQALLLAYNIPGHVIYINTISKKIRHLELRLRGALVRRLQQLSIGFHSNTQSGRLQAKVLRDVEAIEQLLSQVLQRGLEACVSIAISLSIALWHRPLVALFYVVAVPAGIGMIRLFRKRMRAYNRDFRAGVEAMSSRVSEMIEMIPVTRAHGVEEVEIAAVDLHLTHLAKQGRKVDRINALFQSSTWVTMQTNRLMALTVFALMVWHGYLNLAELVLFMAFFDQTINSCMMMLGMVPQLTKGMESIRSLGEVLECPDIEANQGKQVVDTVGGSICFEGVSFTYPERQEAALDRVDLEVRQGECVAFVGESGSGKSTTMNLIIGFFRPSTGRILLDGRDMQDLDLRTWRQHLAVVPQNVLLFSGSLRENITYGLDDIAPDRLDEIINMANLRDVVDQLPEGLDTSIGEHGAQLSGGQRQRIAIARALIRDPAVIILDEATSSLDVISERQVQEAIDRLVVGRTTFIVAHRLSTIRRAERVVVMDQGRVIEEGTQEDLLRRGGAFARLKSLQT